MEAICAYHKAHPDMLYSPCSGGPWFCSDLSTLVFTWEQTQPLNSISKHYQGMLNMEAFCTYYKPHSDKLYRITHNYSVVEFTLQVVVHGFVRISQCWSSCGSNHKALTRYVKDGGILCILQSTSRHAV